MGQPSPNDVDAIPFDEIIINSNSDVLLEFYAPMGGACQLFAPTFRQIAKKLISAPNMTATHFDVIKNSIPDSGEAVGVKLVATSQLYLVCNVYH